MSPYIHNGAPTDPNSGMLGVSCGVTGLELGGFDVVGISPSSPLKLRFVLSLHSLCATVWKGLAATWNSPYGDIGGGGAGAGASSVSGADLDITTMWLIKGCVCGVSLVTCARKCKQPQPKRLGQTYVRVIIKDVLDMC
jgi:hypothetical protein